MGRPSSFTPELADEICRRCVMESLHKVSQSEDMPAESTIYLWLLDQPTFSEKYTRAREARAFRRAESVDEIMEKVATGQLDPKAARVLLDAIKWQTEKENRKAFGAKLELDGNVTLNRADALRERRERAARGG
jgi:hypothetical protein